VYHLLHVHAPSRHVPAEDERSNKPFEQLLMGIES